MDILYFGGRPKNRVAQMLNTAGHRIMQARYETGLLKSAASCRAVVVRWKSEKDEVVIAEAKAIGLPVLVVTSRLADACKSQEPAADVYLEKPVRDEELAALLMDLISATDVAKEESSKEVSA